MKANKGNCIWYYNGNLKRQLFYDYFDEIPEFCEALAYLLTLKKHSSFKVTPHDFSIEISNSEMHIFIIHAVGFHQIEYEEAKKLKNVHFVTISKILPGMVEFSEMKEEIKFISKGMITATMITLTENKFVRTIEGFKKLDI